MAVVWLGAAAAQQIVIEPTNGRPASSSAEKIRRPAVVNIDMGSNNARTLAAPRPAQPKPEAKTSAGRVRPEKMRSAERASAAKRKPAEAAAPLMASTEHEASLPPAKVYPSQPAWAELDTRDNRNLQGEIAGALSRDRRLAGSEIHVEVEDNAVVLTGHAADREGRLEAERLAQSYAWNRKLINKVEVAARVSAQK